MRTISVLILSSALFLALLFHLTLKPRFYHRLMSVCMVLAVVGGLLFYGAGLAETTGDVLTSFIRTPICVTRMFLGVNELGAIQGSRLVGTAFGRFCFWLVHLFAFYSMTSAVLNTLGAGVVRALRLLLSRRGDLTLIYGVNERCVALGQECLAQKTGSVVFITDKADAQLVSDLNNQGMSVLTGRKAADAEPGVLRMLRPAGRKLTVYALEDEADRDLRFALRLKDSLKRMGIRPEDTRLTLPGEEEIISSLLQVTDDAYGFGYVNIFDPARLAARAMIRLCPLWELVSFDADGRAQEDLDCVVVGFGRLGQAVLKSLVMNGQFVASQFHAAVFSPRFEAESGYLRADCPELFRRYDVQSFCEDGQSAAFYEYLEQRLTSLKLIAVCTGSEETDREISDNLMLFLKRRRAEQICVLRVGHSGVRYQAEIGGEIRTQPLYTRSLLSAEEADREAILLNASYDGSDRSDWDKWVSCDSFSKLSSRASADFMPALVRASGASREELVSGAWDPSPELLRVLGETEHLRWCAFHYAMGFRPMSRETFEARAAEYTRCREAGLPADAKISRDVVERLHACLIPWDELDALSEREHALTGRDVDYKQADYNNVLALPRLLRACGKEGITR